MELLTEAKKGLFLGQGIFFWRKGDIESLYHVDASPFSGG